MNYHPQIDKIVQYRRNAMSYYENSESLIKQKELAKAGELLWGAIADAAKALHMIRTGEPVRSHESIRKILDNLPLEDRKKRLNRQHIKAANELHVNFYESNLLLESDFLEQYEYSKLLFGFLMDITEPVNRESNRHTLKP